MATPPILDDAAPGDAPDADADALLAWPEICDLMNLQAPDAWRPRHAAVLAVRRRAQDEGGLDGRPADLFSFLAKESRDLRSASARAALEALGDVIHAGFSPRKTRTWSSRASWRARRTSSSSSRRPRGARPPRPRDDRRRGRARRRRRALRGRLEGARKTLAAETATRLLAAGADAPPGGARAGPPRVERRPCRWRRATAPLATALLRALAPAPDRDAFAEGGGGARRATRRRSSRCASPPSPSAPATSAFRSASATRPPSSAKSTRGTSPYPGRRECRQAARGRGELARRQLDGAARFHALTAHGASPPAGLKTLL